MDKKTIKDLLKGDVITNETAQVYNDSLEKEKKEQDTLKENENFLNRNFEGFENLDENGFLDKSNIIKSPPKEKEEIAALKLLIKIYYEGNIAKKDSLFIQYIHTYGINDFIEYNSYIKKSEFYNSITDFISSFLKLISEYVLAKPSFYINEESYLESKEWLEVNNLVDLLLKENITKDLVIKKIKESIEDRKLETEKRIKLQDEKLSKILENYDEENLKVLDTGKIITFLSNYPEQFESIKIFIEFISESNNDKKVQKLLDFFVSIDNLSNQTSIKRNALISELLPESFVISFINYPSFSIYSDNLDKIFNSEVLEYLLEVTMQLLADGIDFYPTMYWENFIKIILKIKKLQKYSLDSLSNLIDQD